jgi:hypothetical protein
MAPRKGKESAKAPAKEASTPSKPKTKAAGSTPSKRKAAAASPSTSGRVAKRKAAASPSAGSKAEDIRAVFKRGSLRSTLEEAAEPARAPEPEPARVRVDPAEFFAAPAAPPPLTPAEERELRAFDMEMKYGPQVGPTRLQRWERAERLGLAPSRRVHEILKRRAEDDPANASTLSRYNLLAL